MVTLEGGAGAAANGNGDSGHMKLVGFSNFEVRAGERRFLQ